MSNNHNSDDLLKKLKNDAEEAAAVQTRSLPLLHDFKTQLYTLGAKPGMECMPLRSPGPYHYHHVVDQTKSLQELQNEVGALLEFRDLVIETFPDLKHKMASSGANSTITGIPSSSSLVSRREWEPGIRVRRKIGQKENAEISSSSLSRSRSNSHSGKQPKEPKSGEGNGSVVQDSGFSTETSSSKETHSASSTGASQGTANNSNPRLTSDTEDELWNLLDVIHRKSNRLREEVEHLRTIERDKCSKNSQNVATTSPKTFQSQLTHISPDDVQILRKERDRLLDRLSEMEAETLSCKIKESKMQDEMEVVMAAKKELEEQLKAALSQKLELNTKLNDLGIQMFNSSSDSSHSDLRQHRLPIISGTRKISTDTLNSGATGSTQIIKPHPKNTYFTPVVLKSSPVTYASPSDINHSSNISDVHVADNKNKKVLMKNETLLGRLDGVVSSPTRIPKIRIIDSKKIAAILLETNIVELQRHLLTITVQNQVLQQKLEEVLLSKSFFNKQLDKSKEDIEDLRFQLEEKNIELEGARAQLRVIESKSLSKSEYGSPEHTGRSTIILPTVSIETPTPSHTSLYRDANQISTPSMKAMIPLTMDDGTLHHSSSTESAQDHAERELNKCPETPKRRPSKIPLPGQKGYIAPKPPSGKVSMGGTKNPSGPPSNKSLSKSTSSLQVAAGPNSIIKSTNPSPNRSDSAQSWRKDVSIERQRTNSSNSSIPVSATAKGTPTTARQLHNTSPVLLRSKRDSLTSRVKHLDSLSRHMSQSSLSTSKSPLTTTITITKKDLSSSFTVNNNNNSNATNSTRGGRQQPTAPMRRSSSSSATSMHRHHQSNNTGSPSNNLNSSSSQQDATDSSASSAADANKITMSLSSIDKESSTNTGSRQLLTKYLAKNRQPPAIFQPVFERPPSPIISHMNMAYQHPAILFCDEVKITSKSSADDNEDKNNKNSEVRYTSETSIELLDASNTTAHEPNTKESIIVPIRKKMTAFGSMTRSRSVSRENSIKTNGDDSDPNCRLIGKVNPNIVRTWEQLKGAIIKNECSISVCSENSNNDKQSFTLYCRKPYNFKELEERLEKFPVRRMRYSENSGDFFDSIDSLSDQLCETFEQELEVEAAGEVMADYDSLERRKLCWSIDDDA